MGVLILKVGQRYKIFPSGAGREVRTCFIQNSIRNYKQGKQVCINSYRCQNAFNLFLFQFFPLKDF